MIQVQIHPATGVDTLFNTDEIQVEILHGTTRIDTVQHV